MAVLGSIVNLTEAMQEAGLMDRILSEVLRSILPEGTDIARVVQFILAPDAAQVQRKPGPGGAVTVHG